MDPAFVGTEPGLPFNDTKMKSALNIRALFVVMNSACSINMLNFELRITLLLIRNL